MKLSKLLALLLVLVMLVSALASCGKSDDGTDDNDGTTSTPGGGGGGNGENPEFVDYASQVKFNPSSGRAWQEVTVHLYVDGDTTHFNVPTSIYHTGILKARYLGINTPESTGQVEPWGKKASDYTKSKLSAATSIIIESDTAGWNHDSTGERFLVWVWYKTAEMDDYRCLNLEILQNGLARSSKSSDTAYANECTQILNQAVTHGLHVFSKDKDPDFYYGAARPITLRELKTNVEKYNLTRVSFEGVVTRVSGQTAYVEEYDEETGLYFGMQVYFGYNLDYFGLEILKTGNRVRIVGVVTYYESGDTYQVSDIFYDAMDPENEKNIQKLDEGHSGAYQEIGVDDLLNGKVKVEVTETDEEGEETIKEISLDVGFLTMHSTVTVKNLTITKLYTTNNGGSSDGAITITCVDENGKQFIVRTEVLKDSTGAIVPQSKFPVGSVIDVKGVVDAYNGEYQVKLLSFNDVTFH